MGNKRVSESRVISASPGEIFELLADPQQHPVIDGSGTVRSARGSKRRLALGMKFGMDMRMSGAPYKILNTVVEFEEGRLITWRHFNGHRWRWELKPLADGTTEVTETFDWSTAKVPWLISISWFPRTNRQGINRTLDNLEKMFAPAR